MADERDFYRRIQLLEKQKDDLAKRLDDQKTEIDGLKGQILKSREAEGTLLKQLMALVPTFNALSMFVQDNLGQIPPEYFERGMAMAQGKEVPAPKIKVVPGSVKLN
jgi:hypothetical protein